MKKLLLLFIILNGCSTEPKRPLSIFSCSIFGLHGSYARLKIESTFIELAQEEAEKVRKNLVDKKIVPDNTSVMCFKD